MAIIGHLVHNIRQIIGIFNTFFSGYQNYFDKFLYLYHFFAFNQIFIEDHSKVQVISLG